MKCVKEKCPYYKQHDFYESVFICKISLKKFNKDDDVKCIINDEINMKIDVINWLQEIKKKIEKLQ